MTALLNATKVSQENRWQKSEPGEPYWNEGATDSGADYRPSKPKKTEPGKPNNDPVKSGPGEPYWNEGATDPGAYSLTGASVDRQAALQRSAQRFAKHFIHASENA